MVERSPAHEGERRDLERSLLERLADALEPHQLVERVVERTQVRVDLLGEIAGQEAEPLAGFDRGARQDHALDGIALERIDGAGDREVGLAGAGRADAERDVVTQDVLQVLDLVWSSPGEVGAPRAQAQVDVAGDGLPGLFAHRLEDRELDLLGANRPRRPPRGAAADDGALACPPAPSTGTRATALDLDVERRFDRAQVLVEVACQVGEAVVVGRDEGVAKDHVRRRGARGRDCRPGPVGDQSAPRDNRAP